MATLYRSQQSSNSTQSTKSIFVDLMLYKLGNKNCFVSDKIHALNFSHGVKLNLMVHIVALGSSDLSYLFTNYHGTSNGTRSDYNYFKGLITLK